MKHVFRVLADEQGRALAGFVARRLALSVPEVGEHLRRGAVFVGARRQRDGQAPLVAGQKVTVHDLPAASVPATDLGASRVEVVYADCALAVLSKPAGMPSMATRRGGETTLEELAQAQLGPEARLLHRLDREASGVLLVTRSAAARRQLDAQLRAHSLERQYLALVAGRPPRARWTIDRPLLRAGGLARVAEGGKPATTHVERLRLSDGLTLLAVRLETGRMHQIRAHLASDGFPLLGDVRYGGPAGPRLALHAHRLRFTDPSGQLLDVHSPLPRQLARLLGEG